MKPLKIATLAALTLVAACSKDPIAVSTTDNQGIKVDELFTHNGLTIYRFYDSGNPVYFTSRGDISAKRQEYCGKACTRTETTTTLSGEKP